MMRQSGERPVQGLFIYTLLALFALFALIIVTAGARVYQNVRTDAEEMDLGRTALAYVSNKLRAADAADAVRIFDTQEGPGLKLSEQIDGEDYATYIYLHDGYICEYMGLSSRAFEAAFGDKLLQAADFSVTAADGVLTVSVTSASGAVYTQRIFLQCGIGGDEA